MKQWFCIKVMARQEVRASVGVASLGYPTFVPLRSEFVREGNMLVPVKTETKVNGQTISLTGRLLFPGYMFVAFDPGNAGWGMIDDVRGVQRLLRDRHNKPEPIPNRVIRALHRRHKARETTPKKITFKFFPGDEVRIELERVGEVTGFVLDFTRGRVRVLVGVRIVTVKERDLARVKKVNNARYEKRAA